MSIVVIGVNHRTGPLALLERVALNGEQVPKAIGSLIGRTNVSEAVVLSTCNRTEVYAVAQRFHGAYSDIRDFLCELGGLSADELHPHLYSQHDDAAVAHLFQVAAGLDSAVIGESEILGQVRNAWEVARGEGGARATLNLLFRHAVETGKRARTETSIGRGTVSVSHAAVEMATDRLGDLVGRNVLVVGAGEMGEGVAVALKGAGAGDISVANRTTERGAELAARVEGTVVPFSDLDAALAATDVLVTCTGADGVVIDADTVRAARGEHQRPLLIVDIAVPRDVAVDVADLPGVTLLNLDDLRDWAAVGQRSRAAEAGHVVEIVNEEVERFAVESAARQAAPLIAQLHQLAETIRQGELAHFSAKLSSLEADELADVDAVTKRIVAKLLHQVSIRLKDDAGTPQGERNAAAIRDLFDLL
jgi:glutamyl-tRNA reductase